MAKLEVSLSNVPKVKQLVQREEIWTRVCLISKPEVLLLRFFFQIQIIYKDT